MDLASMPSFLIPIELTTIHYRNSSNAKLTTKIPAFGILFEKCHRYSVVGFMERQQDTDTISITSIQGIQDLSRRKTLSGKISVNYEKNGCCEQKLIDYMAVGISADEIPRLIGEEKLPANMWSVSLPPPCLRCQTSQLSTTDRYHVLGLHQVNGVWETTQISASLLPSRKGNVITFVLHGDIEVGNFRNAPVFGANGDFIAMGLTMYSKETGEKVMVSLALSSLCEQNSALFQIESAMM